MIDLAAIRALPVVAPDDHSVTRFDPFVAVPVDVLAALTDAVEAAQKVAAVDPGTAIHAAHAECCVSSDKCSCYADADLCDALAAALAPFGAASRAESPGV